MKRNFHQTLWVRSFLFVAIGFSIANEADAQKGDATLGKVLYKQECVVCHGAEGKGKGTAAHLIGYPKPRDFTRGVYKIRSTSSLPTDQDIFNVISKGIPGTLMPAFRYLTEREQWDLVAYVKTFSESFKEGESLKPLLIPDPPPQTETLLAQGKKLYADYGCVQCHGATGKGDGPSAATLKDDWGDPIIPYDFTIPGKMKAGSTVQDIYRTLAVGIGGTPMPSYGEPSSQEHADMYWALGYYILSLTGEPSEEIGGDPLIGKELFMGARRLEAGGSSCMACHSFAGLGALGGGALGPDLTPVHTKFQDDGLVKILADLTFPTMNAVFVDAPITEEEREHLISFFRKSSLPQRSPKMVGKLVSLAGGGGVLLFALTSFIWRRRLKGVRQELVGK